MARQPKYVATCPRCDQRLTLKELKTLWGQYTGARSRLSGSDEEILVQEPYCGKWLTGDEIKSLWGKATASMRKKHGAGPGKPRSKAPRCACGEMTLKRALARCHKCVV